MRPSTLQKLLQVARAEGVTHLRLGKLEAIFSPRLDLVDPLASQDAEAQKLALAQEAACAREEFKRRTAPTPPPETPDEVPQDADLPVEERIAVKQADAAMADPLLFPENGGPV